MQKNFELSRQQIQQQLRQQLLGQLDTAGVEVQRMAELLLSPLLMASDKSTKSEQILNLLDQRQSELQLNWNISHGQLFDRDGQQISGRGENLPVTVIELLETTVSTETAQQWISCVDGCRQYHLLPILSGDMARYVLVLAQDISNILLNFHSLTGADVAVMSTAPGFLLPDENLFDDWGRYLNALTSYSVNISFMRMLQQMHSFDAVNQDGLILREDDLPVEFHFIRPSDIHDVLLVIIDDIASERDAMQRVSYRNILMALLGVIVIGSGLFFFLSRPLKRISTVSRALPLLGQQQYQTVRDMVSRAQSESFIVEELDVLEDSTHSLSSRLEALEQSVQQQTEKLNQHATELQRERDFVKSLIETSELMIITLDQHCRISSFNHFAEQVSGLSQKQAINQPIEQFFSVESWPDVERTLFEIMQGHRRVARIESAFIDKKGIPHIISWLYSGLNSADDDAVILSVGLDITDKKHNEQQLQWLVDHDTLTELYNRRKFNNEFEHLLYHAQIAHQEGALLLLDLDHFKDINDSFDHKVGDQLLQLVATTLRDLKRDKDIVARLGGDEFALLLPETTIDEAVALCEIISHRLAHLDFTHQGIRHSISCSIGIIKFPMDDLPVDELVSNADLAMYTAKAKGKNTWHLYSPEDMARSDLQLRLKWKQRIETALAQDGFKLVFQPIMSIADGEVNHYEALLRMEDENGQVHRPDAFIPIAEQTGLIDRIDHHVLHLGINKLAEWCQQGLNISLALNLSAHALVDPELPNVLRKLLAENTAARPEQLIFELTETAAVGNIPLACELMQEIHRQGCRFALDDFGTGFSSFHYLRELPVDYIKIDGSFVSHILENKNDQLFVQALVTVAHGMGKKTIAEFVESEAILQFMQKLEVDYAQGYHIGKPSSELLGQHTNL